MTESRRWSSTDHVSLQFTVTGFSNWKKALSRAVKSIGKLSAGSFQKHERSEAQTKALIAFTTSRQGNDAATMLSEAFKTSEIKIKGRTAMTAIFECYKLCPDKDFCFVDIYRTQAMQTNFSNFVEGLTRF